MFADVYHAVASNFAARLHPLQFGRRNQAADSQAPRTPSTGAPRLHTDEHFNHVMSRSAELLERTKRPQSTTWGEQMGQRLGEKHDRVETDDHARVMKRSGDILQNIRNTAAEHRAAAPLPEERHQDNMARSGELLNRIREAQAHAQADAPAPSISGRSLRAPSHQAAPQHSSSGVGRGTQRGLFSPKAAGPRVTAAPAAPEPKPVNPYHQSGPDLFSSNSASTTAPSPVKNPSQFPTSGSSASAPTTSPGRSVQPGIRKSHSNEEEYHDIPDFLR